MFIVGLLAAAISVPLLLAFRFERFIGLRYLLRSRPPRAARLGLAISGGVTIVAFVVLLLSRGHSRTIETIAVAIALLGGMVAIACLLLNVLSVFTTVSTMGVVLGVGSLVVVLSVIGGFEREFRDKVLSANGHLMVMFYGESRPWQETDRVLDGYIEKLKGLPGLSRMTKFSSAPGEVMVGKVGAMLKGIDPAVASTDLKLDAGSFADLTRPVHCPTPSAGGMGEKTELEAGHLIVGFELARRLHARVGQCVSVLVPFSGLDDSPPSAAWFRIIGIFRMGFSEFDSRLAYTTLQDASKLGNSQQQMFGLDLRFFDPNEALRQEMEVEHRLPTEHFPRVIDWETLNHSLFTALNTQRVAISLFLELIIVVAAFNIVASLTMIVLAKIREIAVLSALGASRAALLRIFLVAGTFVGILGTGLGLLFGLLVVGLAVVYGYPLDPKIYLIARLPVQIAPLELLFVAATTLLICMLAPIYPAVRAGRLKVVEGLRAG